MSYQRRSPEWDLCSIGLPLMLVDGATGAGARADAAYANSSVVTDGINFLAGRGARTEVDVFWMSRARVYPA